MRTNFQSEKEAAEKLYKMAKEEVDREQSALLKKMIEKQEHDIKLTKVIAFAECSLLVVLIVVFLVLIPRFFTTVQKVETTMEDVNQLIDLTEKSLENIQDPSNLGTILRTAEALGIEGVILSGNCCDIYSPKVIRGSMGAVFRIPFTIAEDFCGYISELSRKGIDVYASTPYDAEDITNVKFSGGVMLIGNEGSGLTKDVLTLGIQKVKIPMKGRAESLNAAAAAGILMWEMLR